MENFKDSSALSKRSPNLAFRAVGLYLQTKFFYDSTINDKLGILALLNFVIYI